MNVPLLDLKGQYQKIKDEILASVHRVFEEQQFILGSPVKLLEEEIAGYCGCKHAVGVSSGTDALLISLMAFEIRPGDRILTSPYTFFATAGSIARLGGIPVFVDIDAESFNLSPDKLGEAIDRLEKKEKNHLKGIMPIHLFGQCADMAPILEIASSHGLFVIEDAAQAIGSEYLGRRAGSIGDVGCFSFFPSKNLGAFGDGGIVTTDSDELFSKLQIFRVHGASPKYYHQVIGGNFRLDAVQAAVVSVKLKHLDQWTRRRQENASKYRSFFKNEGLEDRITLPHEKGSRHIYNQFVIIAEGKRDGLQRFLKEAGIGTEIYYPVPLHLQKCFSYLGHRQGDFPLSEYAAENSLALPIYPELSDDQLSYVVKMIRKFYR
ncbi:MAG: transcriptional regulator [Deltaproteobacteria bacterium RBG_13_49_15]|nr:MAG: transcriptional regulator [Deltaproteobacteria bacterium RBG_13_49_15]